MSIEIEMVDSDSSFLKRRKTAVARNYKPTRAKSIEEANHLAVYLYCMNRVDEAALLLDSYIETSPYIEHKLERWEAVCFGMLLRAHIYKQHGRTGDFQRLFEIVNTKRFDPSHWVKSFSFEEFSQGIRAGVDSVEYATPYEKLAVRAEGALVCLAALYVWSAVLPNYRERDHEINELLNYEMQAIKKAVS